MFDFIRTHQRLMQLVLLVLIVPSFVLIGVSGYTNYVSGDKDLVKVGDSAVTLQEFELARRNQLEQMQRNAMGRFDPEVLNNRFAREMLLESLVDRRILVDTATRMRFSVSDTVLRNAIAEMPEFQEDGRFSAERYNALLASAGLSTRDFEQGQRGELALQRVLGPVGSSATLPTPVLKGISAALTEARTVRLLTLAAADFEKEITVSDADIQAWYDENKDRLTLPDQVAVEYLVLDEDVAMQAVGEIAEADLQAYYEQNKARYVTAPRVNVSHIQISTSQDRDAARAKAEAIAERVKADPASFADVAREESEDVGTARDGGQLGWISRGSWPQVLEDAVFALPQGGVSGVVEGPGGFHIFMANQVEPEKGETFEQARAKVQAEVRRQLASERFADLATRLTDLVYDNPASLEPAAQALGIAPRMVTGVTRDRLLGVEDAGEQAAAASADAAVFQDPRVRSTLFTPSLLNEKVNSGVIEVSPDTLVVVRVAEFQAAHVPPLEQVKGRVESLLVAQRAREAAQAAGEKQIAALRGAQADAELPEGFGTALTVSRIESQGMPDSVIDAIFAADDTALPAYVGVSGPQGYVVARVEAVEPGPADSPLVAGLSQELARSWGRAEEQAVLQEMRAQAGVRRTADAEEALAGESQE
ncbi:MAG TPA: SurA N-terminal domain-containing protein [Burkholderiaceae bacterium]|nr:SurA N-terminal domain-containing protein [Burkholderiaceae bacterium]